MAVADWDDVEILEFDGTDLILVGHKNTGNRTMGISAKDNFIYSAEWASVQAFEFGEIASPDLDLSTWELNYPFVENGESIELCPSTVVIAPSFAEYEIENISSRLLGALRPVITLAALSRAKHSPTHAAQLILMFFDVQCRW